MCFPPNTAPPPSSSLRSGSIPIPPVAAQVKRREASSTTVLEAVHQRLDAGQAAPTLAP